MHAMLLENGNYLQILIRICPPEESEGIQLQILVYISHPWITAFIPGLKEKKAAPCLSSLPSGGRSSASFWLLVPKGSAFSAFDSTAPGPLLDRRPSSRPLSGVLAKQIPPRGRNRAPLLLLCFLFLAIFLSSPPQHRPQEKHRCIGDRCLAARKYSHLCKGS